MKSAALMLTMGVGAMLARDCGSSDDPPSAPASSSSSSGSSGDAAAPPSDAGTEASVDSGACVSTGGPSVTAGCQACLETQVTSGKIALQSCRDSMTCVCCLTNATGSGISPKPGSCKDTPLFAAIQHPACDVVVDTPNCTAACATECSTFWK